MDDTFYLVYSLRFYGQNQLNYKQFFEVSKNTEKNSALKGLRYVLYSSAKIYKFKFDEIWAPTALLFLDQYECLVHHLKDPIYNCLEPKA